MPTTPLLLVLLAWVLLLPDAGRGSPRSGAGPRAPTEGVVFLTLALTGDGLVLESARLRAGRVRDRRGPVPDGWIHYELVSGEGTRLASGAVPDPRIQRRLGFEAYDPAPGTPGNPAGIPEPRHLVLRVPHHPEARFVRLSSRPPEADRRGGGPGGESRPDMGMFELRPEDLEAEHRRSEAAGARPGITVGTLSTRGSLDGRINVLYIAEGFTGDDMFQFRGYARDAFDYLTGIEPWATYAPYLGAYTLEAVSAEAGSDHPGTARDEPGLPVGFAETMFNSSFDTGGTHRCCYVHDVNLVMGILADSFVQFDLVNFIVNSGWHGGCAGEYAVNTIHGESRFVSVHEIGHVFAGLGDEYETSLIGSPLPAVRPGQYQGPPNLTQETERDLIPWKHWIEPDTPIPTPEDEGLYGDVVGLFRGGAGTRNWYRPKFTCAMRDHLEPFCEVCSEAIVLEIYSLLSPIRDWSPAETEITIGGSEAVTLSVVPMEPAGHSLEVAWSIDGVTVAGADQAWFEVAGGDLDPGPHTVTATVHDPTVFVRHDPDGLLTDRREWSVDRSGAGPAGDFSLRLSLGPGRPNPFATHTSLAYSLPEAGRVEIAVHDALGRRVATLVDREQGPGRYTAVWDGRADDGSRAAAGIYLVRLEVARESRASKLLLTP